jgi:hypothetical protein
MKKKSTDYIITTAGLLFLCGGLLLLKLIDTPQGIMKALPYVLIGVGCGLFGQGTGNIIGKRAVKNNPDIQKQIEIEKNDERNTAVRNRAKAKAYDLMVIVYGALMLSFALMGVRLAAILLLAFSYLLVVGYGVYYQIKFNKEM